MLPVEVKAYDPDGDLIIYHYSISAGQIVHEGPKAQWDLRKALGKQHLTVTVTDARGGRSSRTAEIDVIVHTACHPPCTIVGVSGPGTVSKGEIATFSASVTGLVPDRETELKFTWAQINGEIIGGLGTDSIRVKATGPVGAELQATVEVAGLDPSCSRSASAISKIQDPKSKPQ